MSEPGSSAWRAEQAAALLAFGGRSVLPDGRFGWLADDGQLDPGQPRLLYNTARNIYVWTLAHLAGTDSAARIASGGLASLADFADPSTPGWHTALDPAGQVIDATKTNYDHAHVLLAAATASAAGLPGAEQVLEQATEVISRHFWDDANSAVFESWDAAFSVTESYRGANSAMHSLEAYLTAGDVTGDAVWHARGLALAQRIIDQHARANGWRIPEHYDEQWTPQLEYHRELPTDRFRPYGTTPGHSFEWARLLLGLHDRLAGAGDSPGWLAEAAAALFQMAVADAWAVDGQPGLVYTVDTDGAPIVAARQHWVICEAILAADALDRTSSPASTSSPAGAAGASSPAGPGTYASWLREWWQFVDRHVIDRVHGGWWHELGPDLHPTHTVWTGKPDLYHAYQALLFPSLPSSPCAALVLARPAVGTSSSGAPSGDPDQGPERGHQQAR